MIKLNVQKEDIIITSTNTSPRSYICSYKHKDVLYRLWSNYRIDDKDSAGKLKKRRKKLDKLGINYIFSKLAYAGPGTDIGLYPSMVALWVPEDDLPIKFGSED